MSIDPKDLEQIDNQIKIQRGNLPISFEKDDGDTNPPDVTQAIHGMGTETEQKVSEGGIDVAIALKGFWKFVDMMISLICSRVDVINYKNLSDAELTNISQQTSQVEIFQKLAVAENAPLWLSVANLVGTFGTKFTLSPEWKEEQKRKKALKELEKRKLAKLELSPSQKKIIQGIKEKQKINEPVYDGIPKDNSEPIEILDESERKIKEQLSKASEVTNEDIKKMKIARRAEAIKRKFEEEEVKKRSQNSKVGILDE